MARCKHVWSKLIPTSSQLEADSDTRIKYFCELISSPMTRLLICVKCTKTGHEINSARGGIRIHDSDYFLNKAQGLSIKYGFKLATEKSSGIVVDEKNIIPEMTHPLSKGWDAPDRSEIQIDHQYARMKKSTFDKLQNYCGSVMRTVYEGKMWKSSQDKIHWLLHWWSASDNPDKCKCNTREIIIHE